MAQTKPLEAKADPHPVIAALHGRGVWEPRPFTRAISRVSPGTRAIADQVRPRELEWCEIGIAALESDLPLWVVLGDSIPQGIGATDISRSWVARIAGALAAEGRPHAILNLSRSGDRSRHVRYQQVPLLRELPRLPALITCGAGTNDLMRNPHPPAVAARVNELIKALPIATIISTLPTPPMDPAGRWVNRSMCRTAEENCLRVADIVPHLVGSRRGWASDRFHPSDAGYGAWVETYRIALDLDPRSIPDSWDPRAR